MKRTIAGVARLTRVGSILPLKWTMRLYGGTDKGQHGYAPFYARHFGPHRFRAGLILEIGVGGYQDSRPGGSLRVWRDYFPRSRIVGMDLHEKQIDLGPRVIFERGDQSSAEDLQRVLDQAGRAPDIVIDDGSHIGEHVATSFGFLFPLLPAGSIYVIEDLHTSYWTSFGGAVPAPSGSAVGLLRSLIDSVQLRDETFERRPGRPSPQSAFEHVEKLFVYPGIAFVYKA